MAIALSIPYKDGSAGPDGGRPGPVPAITRGVGTDRRRPLRYAPRLEHNRFSCSDSGACRIFVPRRIRAG